MSRISLAASAAVCLGLACSTAAFAAPELKVDLGGSLQYDLRFRTSQLQFGPWYRPYPKLPQVSRNELKANGKIKLRYGKVGMVGDVDLVLRAYPNTPTIGTLSTYNAVSPFRIEAHELYFYARDLFGASGLDVRIGQQKAMFGMGDLFNPTNNVNPNNLEDILLFGNQQGNLMVRLDYSPAWNWQLTGILVPIFKPALVPRTAFLGQTIERVPYIDETMRLNIGAETAWGEQLGYPTQIENIGVALPEFSAANMQYFFRVGATLGGQDIALSYYNGFTDIPQGSENLVYQTQEEQCRPLPDGGVDEDDCIKGMLLNDVVVRYPKMQVLGYNMAGEIPLNWIHKSVKGLGYRMEVAVIFPEEQRLTIMQDNLDLGILQRDGEYVYPVAEDGTPANRVVSNQPFAKWTLGLDYTFSRHFYLNLQWVHGFPDEFGAGSWVSPNAGGYNVRDIGYTGEVSLLECLDVSTGDLIVDGTKCTNEVLKPRINDYLVAGFDIKFLGDRGLIRVFNILDLGGVYFTDYDPETEARYKVYKNFFTKEGFSMTIFPAFSWNFGGGFTWEVGGLIQLGQVYSKFGSPEVGGTQVWTRARYRF